MVLRRSRLPPRPQPRVQLHAAFLIDGKERTSLHLHAPVEDGHDVRLSPELRVEQLIEFLGPPHLDHLRGHDRPGKDREEHQDNDDPLALGRGLVPDEHQFDLICLRQ